MIKESIAKLLDKKNLDKSEAYETMKDIMSGKATPSLVAGFLVALRMKGETADEVAGCALAMRDAANPVIVNGKKVVDNCGTGGDGKGGLNLSTAAAFVVAGAGIPVAKHGNKSISSKCGSADVLAELGVKIDTPPLVTENCIKEAGIGFMFAPNFHPAMRYAMPTRKELGVRTVFNILGPLSNPAKVKVQLIGVYDPSLLDLMARVMLEMGQESGLVVHTDGWDEISLTGTTQVAELYQKKITHYKLEPADFGLSKGTPEALKGGDAGQNAKIIREILEGKKHPAADAVIANAAALIWITERTYGNKDFKLKEAVKKAKDSIQSGEALKRLTRMSEVSHAFT